MKIIVSGFCLNSWNPVKQSSWRVCGAILALHLSLLASAFAQNKLWDKTIGSSGDDVFQTLQETKDGGYILGGYSYSEKRGDKSENSKGGHDYWIVKQKADGSKEWDKTIGGNNDDYLLSIQQTQDNGYILGGSSYSGKSSDKSGSNKGSQDYWVVKINAQGAKIWDKTLGGTNDDVLQIIQQTQDGGYILGGHSASALNGDKSQASRGGYDYWIVKLKPDGSKEWDRTFGSNNHDWVTSIQQTKNGGYIVAGFSDANISGDKSEDSKGNEDYWIIKLKADGSKEWDKTLGGNNPDILNSMEQTQDGGYILGGYSLSGLSGDKSQSSKGGQDYWVVKLQADGSKEWDKTIGGNSDDNLIEVRQTREGSYILGGWSVSGISGNKTQGNKGGYDYWIVKLKVDGTYAWDKTIGANYDDYLTYLQPTTDNNYIMGGYSYSPKSGDKSEINKGGYDYWIVKLDNSGTNLNQIITFAPILYKNLDDPPFTLAATTSSGLAITYKIESGPATISNGNLLTLTGVGTVRVKASQAGNATYLPAAVTRTFVVEAASVVAKQWNKTIGGSSTDQLTYMQQTSDKGYILGGTSYSGKNGDKTTNSKGGSDYWIVKLKADGSKDWDKTFGGNSQDVLSSVQQTNDGGYILGGYSLTSNSGDKTQARKGREDYWIIKLRADGSKEWDQTYGGRNPDWLTSVIQTRDGGYLLGGYSLSGIGANKAQPSQGLTDYWLIKIKPDGGKQWDRTIGGRYEDVLSSLQQTQDGGYILGGSSLSGVSGDKTQARIGSNDYWIVKLNTDGTKEWDKTIGGSDEDYLTVLQQTQDGGYILGGYSWSSTSGDKTQASKGGHDYWVVKLNANGRKDWDKTLGGNESDALMAVRQTQDGGYILGGNSFSAISGDKTQVPRGAPDYDYWVVKLKADGTKAWDKTLGGSANDLLVAVLQTNTGEYLVGGSSESGILGDKSESSRGSTDFWLVKLKEEVSFNTVWNYRFGGSGEDNFTIAIQTQDRGYLAGGYSGSGSSGDKSQSSQGQNDYWIVKSDKNGQKEWDKRYGGLQDDHLNRVIQTNDGGYLLGGSSWSGKGGNKTENSQGEQDFWIVKIDAQGNQQWDKRFGGSGQDDLKRIVELPSGDYVLGGTSDSPISGDKTQNTEGGKDYWLLKVSSTGEKLWDQRYGGTADEMLGSFTETRDGGFFLGGTSLSGKSGNKSQASQGAKDYWVVRTDKEGNVLWDKTFGGSADDEVYSVGRSLADYLFIAGTSSSGKSNSKSQPGQGGKDYWVIKIDKQGQKVWDKTYGGDQDDDLRACTYTDEGHYILAGTSNSGESGDKTQPSQGDSDYWVVQADEDGQYVVDQRFGGSGSEELRTVFQTNDGGWLLGGRSNSGASGNKTQPSQGSTDYWLVKVAPGTLPAIASRKAALPEETIQTASLQLTAYPNPILNKAIVNFKVPKTQPVRVKVFDNQGRELTILFQGEAKANQTYQVNWQASEQTNGMYFLQLQTPTQRNTLKLLLQK